MPRHLLTTLLLPAWLASSPAFAQVFTATDRQPTPAELASLPAVVPEKAETLIAEVKAPTDFEVSIFATPPAVNYPVFVAADVDGTLYVSSDGNGSLDRKPHLGRVLRVRDTDNDGRADEVKAFVPDVDSPRGLVWDHDRLYLLHPPDVSVFHDRDRDGIAESRETLVRGIAFTFKDRPADHSSNGLEMGVDGWLYAAIGDFGFLEAVGTDGRKLQLRGGGVVRFRPDGSDLELWADGTRNILEVAVSPLLDGFARDNTNDGGGWDVRFHHFSGLTQHGYPRLFKNFADEIIQPLADYGGGSGCGAAWIDEEGIPSRWNNAAFTADWGREWIYHHRLKPNGATFTVEQQEFLRLPRVTDLDADGRGNIYAASWKGASFTWAGPDVGFLVRLKPRNFIPDPVPDYESLTETQLSRELNHPSHRRRLAAQRALIRRGQGMAVENNPPLFLDWINDPTQPLAVSVAAIFGLKQAAPQSANSLLERLANIPRIRPWILRALADRPELIGNVRLTTFTDALDVPDPRARKEALLALARLRQASAAPLMLRRVADPDPVVAHAAVQTLIQLRAAAPCLDALDASQTPPAIRTGALRILQSIHEPEVVDALIRRLHQKSEPARRADLITALCRLHFIEGPWKGDSWGTRPDTRGPFYQPETWSASPRIADALDAALRKADGPETAHLAREIARHRIPAAQAIDLFLARATADPSITPALAAQLSLEDTLPPAAVPILARFIASEDAAEAPRAQAAIALTRSDNPAAWHALLAAYDKVQQVKTENNLAEKARSAVLNSPALDRIHPTLAEVAARTNGPASTLADALLLRLASRRNAPTDAREAAANALDSGWQEPRRRTQIIRAATRIGDASRAMAIALALDDPDAEVANAARDAVQRLRINPDKLKAEAGQATLADLPTATVLNRVATLTGDPARGEQLFTQLSCQGCHTVRPDEPLKGPFLGTIAQTYRRLELAEAILIPNKSLAQGFITHHFELADGSEIDGFVIQEAADAVTIRTVTAEERRIPVPQIVAREKQQRSLMPEGLAAGLTLGEFASLLDYLQALSANPTNTATPQPTPAPTPNP
jgi:putative membrane-bound dehydrogenase-like protein